MGIPIRRTRIRAVRAPRLRGGLRRDAEQPPDRQLLPDDGRRLPAADPGRGVRRRDLRVRRSRAASGGRSSERSLIGGITAGIVAIGLTRRTRHGSDLRSGHPHLGVDPRPAAATVRVLMAARRPSRTQRATVEPARVGTGGRTPEEFQAAADDEGHRAGHRVSRSTVSRILSDAPLAVPIAAETRERVLTAARELGFRPNPLARALRGAPTMLLGAIVRDITDPFFTGAIEAVSVEARALGYNIVLGHAHAEATEAYALATTLEAPNVTRSCSWETWASNPVYSRPSRHARAGGGPLAGLGARSHSGRQRRQPERHHDRRRSPARPWPSPDRVHRRSAPRGYPRATGGLRRVDGRPARRASDGLHPTRRQQPGRR